MYLTRSITRLCPLRALATLLGVVVLLAPVIARTASVLVLRDTVSQDSIAQILSDAGHTVTIATDDLVSWDGEDPSPFEFDCVVLPMGARLDDIGGGVPSDMTLEAQEALGTFVGEAGGGVVLLEWTALEMADGKLPYLQGMSLFDPATSGVSSGSDQVTIAASHPITDGIASSFTVASSEWNTATPVAFAEVLATGTTQGPVLLAAEGEGARVVHFAAAPGSGGLSPFISGSEFASLLVQSVAWAGSNHLVHTLPEDGRTDVALNERIYALPRNPIDVGLLNSSNFYVESATRGVLSAAIDSTFIYFAPDYPVQAIQLAPDSPFNAFEELTVHMLQAGTGFDRDYEWSFTASDQADLASPPVPSGLVVMAWEDNLWLDWDWDWETNGDVAYFTVKFGTDPGNLDQEFNVGSDEALIGGLTACTEYTVAVSAVDFAGNESGGATGSATTNESGEPPAPTGLVATPQDSSVLLTWNTADAPCDLDFYAIYRSDTPGGPYSQIAAVPAGTDSFLDSPLYSGSVTYYYVLFAMDLDGVPSQASAEASATPPDNTPPSAPANLAVIPGDGFVDLTWTESSPIEDVSGYRVYWGYSSGAFEGYYSTTAPPYRVGGMNQDVEYFFEVTAVDYADPANESAPSNEVSATVATPRTVLVLRDTVSQDDIASMLTAAGYDVTICSVDLTQYDGTNPSPFGFQTVVLPLGVHLDDLGGGVGDMPVQGQYELNDYVNWGGGLVLTEWVTADKVTEHLVFLETSLFDPAGATSVTSTEHLTVNDQSHWIADGVPIEFDIGSTDGVSASPVAEATVLVSGDVRGPLVAYADLQGVGRVVHFALAPSAGNSPFVQGADLGTMLTNAVSWTSNSQVMFISPEGGEADVPLNARVLLVPARPIQADTLSSSNFYLESTTRGVLAASISHEITDDGIQAIWLTPDLVFLGNEQITINLLEAGSPFDRDYTWTFTTGTEPDTTPPTAPDSLVITLYDSWVDVAWSWDHPAEEADLPGFVLNWGTDPGVLSNEIHTSPMVRNAGFAPPGECVDVYVEIRAIDMAGNQSGALAGSSTTLKPGAPAAPIGVVATAGDSQVQLTWDAGSADCDVVEFQVHRDQESGEPYFPLATGITGGSYTDLPLHGGTLTYYYGLIAVDRGGLTSPYSTEVSALPWDTTPPSPPSDLSAVAGDGYIDLDWTAAQPAGDVDHYLVYWGYASGAYEGSYYTPAPPYRVNGTQEATPYYFAVSAVDGAIPGNESGPSNEVSVTPPDTTPPSVPLNLALVEVGADYVDLSWDPSVPSEDVAGYTVHWGTESGVYGSTSTTASTTARIGSLQTDTTYYFAVSSYDAWAPPNESALSSEVSATPVDPPPAEPTGVVAGRGVAAQSVDVTWNPNAEPDLAGYIVYVNGVASDVGNVTATTILDIASCPPWTVEVSAYDLGTNESPRSTPALVPFGVADYRLVTSEDVGPAFEWEEISASGEPALASYGDFSSGPLPVPFPFGYWGSVPEFAYINRNGFLSFESYGSFDIVGTIPDSAEPNGMVAPFWAYQWGADEGNIPYVQALGDAPDRRWIIQWNGMIAPGPTGPFLYEAVLREHGDFVDLRYASMPGVDQQAGYDVVVGLESPGGLQAVAYHSGSMPVSISDTFVLRFEPRGRFVGRTFPRADISNAPTNSRIRIEFGRDMSAATLDETTVLISGAVSGAASGTYEYYQTPRTLVFTPDSPFVAGERVEVAIAATAEDMEGIPIGCESQRSFDIGTGADVTPPLAVTGLTAVPEHVLGEIRLRWDASSEQDTVAYRIYRDEVDFTDVTGMVPLGEMPEEGYLDLSPPLDTDLYFAVTAIDLAGNEETAVSTVGPIQVRDDPPGVPTGVRVEQFGGGTDVLVSWNPNPEPDVLGYKVHVDGVAHDAGASNEYAPSLTGCPPYSFQVSAYDAVGQEGPRSASVRFLHPFSDYTVASSDEDGPAFDWIDLGPNGVDITTDLQPDGITGSIDLGFEFSLYGQGHNEVYITDLGFLAFSPFTMPSSLLNQELPDTDAPNGIIAPFWGVEPYNRWDDHVAYLRRGSPPHREFVVQWREDAVSVLFQAVLREGTNEVLFQYLDVMDDIPEQSWDEEYRGENATVGIESDDGNLGEMFLYDEPALHDGLAVRFRPSATLVLQTDPEDGDNNVPTNAGIQVVFGTAMNLVFLGEPNVTIVGSASGAKPFARGLDATGKVLTLKPTTPFMSGETVTVTIGAGVQDAAGNPLGCAHAFAFTVGTTSDDTAPDPVAGLAATVDEENSDVYLRWDASPEWDLAEYRVYRHTQSFTDVSSASLIAMVADPGFVDVNNVPDTQYWYAVTAVDLAGNEDPDASAVSVTPVDNPPASPTGLVADDPGIEQAVHLSWNENAEKDLFGYRVYLDGELLVDTMSGTEVTVTSLDPCPIWRFEVTAVDAIGQESPPSSPAFYGYQGSYDVLASDEGTSVFQWESIQPTSTNANIGPGDWCAGGIPIGFEFPLFSGVFDSVSVQPNGTIGFGEPCVFDEQPQISSYGGGATPSNNVFYETRGTAPDRRFVLWWVDMPDPVRYATLTWQAVLHEDGDIAIEYLSVDHEQVPQPMPAIEIVNADGSESYQAPGYPEPLHGSQSFEFRRIPGRFSVMAASPPAGATDVAINTPVLIRFSEDLDPATVSSVNLSVAGETSGEAAGTWSFGGSPAEAYFTPTVALGQNELYTVTVGPDVAALGGEILACTEQWTFTTGTAVDDVPPPPVTGLAAQPNHETGEVYLSWHASPAPDLAEYRVYRSPVPFTDISAAGLIQRTHTLAFTDTTALPGTDYYYAVTAVDGVNNEDTSVVAVGPITVINDPPAATTGLAVKEQYGWWHPTRYKPDATWSWNQEPDVTGYRVYRDGTPTDVGDVNQWRPDLSGNCPPTEFRVSAVDGVMQEGPISDPVLFAPISYRELRDDGSSFPFVWARKPETAGDAGLECLDQFCISAQVPIGFDFPLFEKQYAWVQISAHGTLLFGGQEAGIALEQFELPLGQVVAARNIHYWTRGVEPHRVFYVQWTRAYQFYPRTDPPAPNTFQIALFEGSGRIEARYLDIPGWNGEDSIRVWGVDSNHINPTRTETIDLTNLGNWTSARVEPYRLYPVSRYPEDAEPGIPTTSRLFLEFGADMDESTLLTGALTATGGVSGPAVLTYEYLAAERLLIATPAAPFAAGEIVALTLDGALLGSPFEPGTTEHCSEAWSFAVGMGPDTIPPAPVADLDAGDALADGGGVILLAWTPNLDPDLAEYRVFRDTVSFTDITGRTPIGITTEPRLADATAENGVQYHYAVVAADRSGNVDSLVEPVGPVSSHDNAAPPAPVLTLDSALGQDASLSWTDGAGEPAAASYTLYWGANSPGASGSWHLTPENPSAEYSFGDCGIRMLRADFSKPANWDYLLEGYNATSGLWDVLAVDLGCEFIYGNPECRVAYDYYDAPDYTAFRVRLYDGPGYPVDELDVSWRVETHCGWYENSIDLAVTSHQLTGLDPCQQHFFAVGALDDEGDESQLSNEIARLTALDGIPAQVVGLEAQSGELAVSLSWSPTGDCDLAGYRIYRQVVGAPPFTLHAEAGALDTTFEDTDLVGGIPYIYVIAAVDTDGLEGQPSNPATGHATDTTAPAQPQGLLAYPGDGSVHLQWLANSEPDVAGYNLYHGENPAELAGPTDLGPVTAHTVTGLTNGTTYYFQLTAYDTHLNEGYPSATVSEVPRPTPGVLLVDDDAGSGYDAAAALTASLTDLGYEYSYWEIAFRQALPPPEFINAHEAVIWATGQAQDPLTPAEATAIMGFLDQGGALFLCGGRNHDSLVYSGTRPPELEQLGSNYLSVYNFDEDLGVDPVRFDGTPGDPIGNGVSVPVFTMGFHEWPSVTLEPGTAVVFRDGVAGNIRGFRKPDTGQGQYRIVYLAAPFASLHPTLPDPDNQTAILGRILGWLRAPTVVSTVPPDGATNVKRNTNISLWFSRPMNPATVRPEAISVVGSSSGAHDVSLLYHVAERRAILDPTEDFTAYESVTVTIDTSVTTQEGIPLPAPFAFGFDVAETRDTTPPQPILEVGAYDTPSDQGGSVDVVWLASDAQDFSLYRVYRDTAWISDVSGLSAIAELGTKTQTVFHDTTAPADTDLFYAVTAVDWAGNENPFTVENGGPARALDNLPPDPPQDLTASEPDDGVDFVSLSWSPPGQIPPDFDGYRVHWGAYQPSYEGAVEPTTGDVDLTFPGNGCKFSSVTVEVHGASIYSGWAVNVWGVDEHGDIEGIGSSEHGFGDLDWPVSEYFDPPRFAEIGVHVDNRTGHSLTAEYRIVTDCTDPDSSREVGEGTSTVIEDLELCAGNTFTVVSLDDSGNASLPSNAVRRTFTWPGTPVPPQSFAGSAGDGFALLSWEANPECDIAGYRLRRSESPAGPWSVHPYVDTVHTDLFFIDGGLPNGHPFYYTLAALDQRGKESLQTPVVAVTPGAAVEPTIVRNVVSHGLDEAIEISWNPNPEPTVNNYRVYWGLEEDVFEGVVDVGPATSYLLTGLDPCTCYVIAVSAQDASGAEGPRGYTRADFCYARRDATGAYEGGPFAFTSEPGPPLPPNMLSAEASEGENKTIAVSFEVSPSCDATGEYRLYRAPAAGGPWVRAGGLRFGANDDGPVTVLTYWDAVPENGVDYYYYVTAVDWQSEESVPSAIVSAQAEDQCPPLAPDLPILATEGTDITVSWTRPYDVDDPTFGPAGYKVHYSTGSVQGLDLSDWTSEWHHQVTERTVGTAAIKRVEAHVRQGELIQPATSEWSAVWTSFGNAAGDENQPPWATSERAALHMAGYRPEYEDWMGVTSATWVTSSLCGLAPSRDALENCVQGAEPLPQGADRYNTIRFELDDLTRWTDYGLPEWPREDPADGVSYMAKIRTWQESYENVLDVGKVFSSRLEGLDTCTHYFVAVTAYDEAGNDSEYSAEASILIGAPGAPEMPHGFAAEEWESSIFLAWLPNEECDVKAYEVHRSEYVDGVYELVQEITATAGEREGWQDPGIRPGEVRCYKVRARDTSGLTSAFTAPVCTEAVNEVPPHQPLGLAGLGRETFIDLTWIKTHEKDLDHYKVYYREALREWLPPIAVGNVDAYRLMGLAPCTMYEITITAVDWGGLESEPSPSISVTTTMPGRPEPVLNLVATAGDERVYLDWEAPPGCGLDHFAPYRSTLPGQDFHRIRGEDGASYAWTRRTWFEDHTDLVNGVTYYYMVRAVDSSGVESDWGTEVSATPTADHVPPEAPEWVNAIRGDTVVELMWATSPEKDVDEYHVFMEDAVPPGGSVEGLTPAVVANAVKHYKMTARLENLTNEHTYYFAVIAIDYRNNKSEPSQWVAATPTDLHLPSTVANISAESWPERVVLRWNPVTRESDPDFAAYRVYVDANAIPDPVVGLTPVHTIPEFLIGEADVGGLVNEQEYHFGVTVVDVDGNEGHPTTIAAVPQSPIPKITLPTVPGVDLVVTQPQVIVEGLSLRYSMVRLYRGPTLVGETGPTPYSGRWQFANVELLEGENTFTATAEYEGSTSDPSEAIVVIYDNPPAEVQNLTAEAGDTIVILRWDDNTEPDLAGYYVYRNGSLLPVNFEPYVGNQFVDGGLTDGKQYSYIVRSVDQRGHESDDIPPVSGTPLAEGW